MYITASVIKQDSSQGRYILDAAECVGSWFERRTLVPVLAFRPRPRLTVPCLVVPFWLRYWCCARFPTLLYDHHYRYLPYTCIYCMHLLHTSTAEETNNTALGEYRWYYLIYTVERLESSTRLRGFAPFPTCWTLG